MPLILAGRKHTTLTPAPSAAAIPALLLAFFLAGCGNFWQNPNGSSTTSSNPSSSGGTTTSTTTLTAASPSTTAGTGDGLTATVAPNAATGTVTFLSNGATIGSATLAGGTAAYTATFTAAGVNTVTASYGGDGTYAASTSGAVTVTVTASTTLSASALSASLAQPPADLAQAPNLVLDPAGAWAVPATSYAHNIAGLAVSGNAVQNIQSAGHCVYYSGKAYLASGAANANGVYTLPGGGFLAPTGTPSLNCE